MDTPIKRLAKKIITYKYITFFITLAILSLLIYLNYKEEFLLKNFILNLFYAVISAIILSLFYDLFTRTENKLLQQVELDEVKTIVSNSILNYVQFDLLDQVSQKDFIKKMYHNDTFLKELSGIIVEGKNDEVFHSLFKTLRDGNTLLNVDVENNFRASPNGHSYTIEFKQRFRAPKEMKEFFVIYSCDNDLYNSIFFSKSCVVESAIGTSRSEWNKIDQSISTMYLRGETVKNGKKISSKLKPTEIKDENLFSRIPIENLNDTNIRAFIFKLPENHTDYLFEFYYEVENSLADPYYYWIAENPMHLNSISFNYEHIKNSVGLVSANCIMGNQFYEPIHDRNRGIYSVKINNLVWPGQGALLVWRPK